MKKKADLNCKLCNKKITQDRCNVNFNIERQDFPFETDWQSSSDFNLKDICFDCYTRLLKVLRLEKDNIMSQKWQDFVEGSLLCPECGERIQKNSTKIIKDFEVDNFKNRKLLSEGFIYQCKNTKKI